MFTISKFFILSNERTHRYNLSGVDGTIKVIFDKKENVFHNKTSAGAISAYGNL